MSTRIPTYFYGSFINIDVLARGGFIPRSCEVCVLNGYDINAERLATLVPSHTASVYGILALASHQELSRLYAQDWLHGTYAPEPVVVRTLDGALRVSLCYVAENPAPWPADDYLDWILISARNLGFPDWYLRRIEHWRRAPQRS